MVHIKKKKKKDEQIEVKWLSKGHRTKTVAQEPGLLPPRPQETLQPFTSI